MASETLTTDADTSDRFFSTMLQISVGLIVTAVVLSFVSGGRPWGDVRFDASEWMLGVAGAVALFLSMWASGQFNDFLIDRVAPRLAALAPSKIVLLVPLLAVGEELVFRGALPELFRGWSPMWAIVFSNAIYACFYAVNRGAFITMFLVGCYLSALFTGGDHDSILRPIVAHTLFLYGIAFGLRRGAMVRQQEDATPAVTGGV